MPIKLFVYGTLKRGFCRHRYLAGQRYLGQARTVPRYHMYCLGEYPGLIESPDGVAIEGEMWEIDDRCLQTLDAVEEVPVQYSREVAELEGDGIGKVETYVYRLSIDGLADCGTCWITSSGERGASAP